MNVSKAVAKVNGPLQTKEIKFGNLAVTGVLWLCSDHTGGYCCCLTLCSVCLPVGMQLYGDKDEICIVFSDDKNAVDLVSFWVGCVFSLAVQRWPLIILPAFENLAQFCHISPVICRVFYKEILQISLDFRAVLTQGTKLRVNNAGTQRRKKYQRECGTALKHEYIFTFRTETVMF